MAQEDSKRTSAQQIELVISKLDSFSLPGGVAAQLFVLLLEPRFASSRLAEIIESEPALAAMLLSLAHRQGLDIGEAGFSFRRLLDKLPVELVRETFLSCKVSWSADNEAAGTGKQLILHSIAVGCTAGDIAEMSATQINPQLAYLAGLLHDIGKFAMREVMPKSLARIVEQAKAQGQACCVLEQEQLGLDHTIIGKRLAEKWHLPEEVGLGIWLHHSDTATISQEIGKAAIAQIVQLADLIARQCSIGQSGSFDAPVTDQRVLQYLEINQEQVKQIGEGLAERVRQKSKAFGPDLEEPLKKLCDTMQSAAGRLSTENAKLADESRKLQAASSHLDFISEFLSSVELPDAPIALAQELAIRWQRFYQTGRVCLYLAPSEGTETIEAVVVENLAESKTVLLEAPDDSPPIPEAITKQFAVLDAWDCADWLFEQLDTDFDRRETKIAPLLSAGRAIGAIVFELRYPGDIELFEQNLKTVACIMGVVLDMASSGREGQRLAERFVRLIGPARQPIEPAAKTGDLLRALAEMAAGAAHEFNNPLTVISGQSQLLASTETDAEKKESLKKIEQSCRQLSQIIEGLMNFAEPAQPRPASTNIRQILDEAAQLAAQKTNSEQLDIKIEIAGGPENVFVDSAQLASAIANIFSNSVESYEAGGGPVKVLTAKDQSGDSVKLTITDSGCGMDEETLRKATQPFFSARPAGRKRGMGLAYAVRLIESNGGSLNITSVSGEGTTVTILLPQK